MAFIYRDNAGTAYSFSGNSLKEELLLFQAEDQEALPSVLLEDNELDTGEETDTANLQGLYTKLNFEIKEISNNDLIRKFSESLTAENLDMFSSIFSFNKTHFKAIIYLLYTDLIQVEDIKELLDADVLTRNKILISKFPEYQNNNMLISKLANIILPIYFSSNNQFTSIRVNESKEFSILDVSTGLFPEQYYLLKNIFFNASFQNVVWNKNNFNQRNIRNNTKNTTYTLFGAGRTESTTYVKAESETDYIYYRSFLEALSNPYYRDSNSESRIISSENFISYILNSYFMEFSRLSLTGKLNSGRSAQIRESNKKTFVENGLKMASSYALSDNGSKPTSLSIFHHIYFAYNNTSNYLTLEDFNFNDVSSNFNITNETILNSIYDFSYVTDESTRSFLRRLFPNFFENERTLHSYSYRYFLNKTTFDTYYYSNPQNSTPTSYLNIRAIMVENLYKNVTLINDARIVTTIGGSDVKNYFEKAISLAVQSIEDNEAFAYSLNVLDYESFNLPDTVKAVESLNAIKSAIIAHIESQTVTTNRYINETTLVYKTFLVDLIDSYFGFLTDPSKTKFEYEVSVENLKLYKLLNFIKHIFINLYPFITLAKESKPLLDFYALILSVKGYLTEAEVREIVNKTYSEIEQLFKK
jgi:hypothetical protein